MIRRSRTHAVPRRAVGDRPWGRLVGALLAYAFALVFFFPVLWMLLTAFKTEQDAQTTSPNLNFSAGLDRFHDVTASLPGTLTFVKALGNSAFVVIASTLIVMILAVPAAYALAIRPVPKWRDVLFFFISTKFLPVAAAILPLYKIFKDLGLLDKPLALIIVYTSMNLPLAVWMLRSFFADLPRSILEAAEVDGAGFFRRVTWIMLPLVGPGLSATALLCFIFAWNEFFLVVNLTSFNAQTVPIWVTQQVSTRGQFLAKLSAASTLACIPVVAAGWIAQKRLVRGLTMGAVK